jgi:predicted RNA-binding Zn-ribbon protein involved in translation (DUF1610 family)
VTYVREGALWVQHKPLTSQEISAKWREKLGPLVCPECGFDLIEETTKGWILDEEHYHDPNRKTCLSCGHQWFRPCPTCGEVRTI